MISLAILISASAELIGICGNIVQLSYVVKKKTIKGLSGWGWTLGLGGNIAWVVYGIQKTIIPLVVANIVLAVIAVMMLARLYVQGNQQRRMIMYAVAVGATLSAMFVLFRGFSGWLAFIYGTASRLPQLYRAYRDKNLKGVSLRSQMLWLLQNGLVVIYAVMLGAWPLAATAIIGVASSVFLVFQVAKKGRSS